ncbi:hypothetical protein GCM10007973_15660 [Polymorphobacter multimanifer]|uniref:Uncharacterized protein n=1 Tax=Polymorphobacter multimanifer TaxID=1070431 RepID=A0A841L1L6_9SPHN|nr:hypothetical protein [Polymorphobacter multimanifer]MBB6226557.1 hypothetical protein [Polymorphobacter multimanifer]GGI79912.1 hypothetical protein GCM10007973_15660 [Polymorphobacter multimanifer]
MRLDFQEHGAVIPRVEAPVVQSQSPPPLRFDMPTRVLTTLVALSAGYLAVMGLAFVGDAQGLALVFAVFGIVLAGFYGLPWVMARVSGGLGADAFERKGAWGMDTASGYLTSHAALAQILTVPVLMLAWAVFVLAII